MSTLDLNFSSFVLDPFRVWQKKFVEISPASFAEGPVILTMCKLAISDTFSSSFPIRCEDLECELPSFLPTLKAYKRLNEKYNGIPYNIEDKIPLPADFATDGSLPYVHMDYDFRMIIVE